MQGTDKNTSWVEQLEVTNPIKSIMGFVDDLSSNYERRIAAMHADYQKDVEEIVACYKLEKKERQKLLDEHQSTVGILKKERQKLIAEHNNNVETLNKEHQSLLEKHENTIESLKTELQTLTLNYNKLDAEHKVSLVSLETTKGELSKLVGEFKSEEELIALTKKRIELMNKQLAIELGTSNNIFSKFSSMCMRIITRRKTSEIIIGSKQDPIMLEEDTPAKLL